jgi:hypothetical protein
VSRTNTEYLLRGLEELVREGQNEIHLRRIEAFAAGLRRISPRRAKRNTPKAQQRNELQDTDPLLKKTNGRIIQV